MEVPKPSVPANDNWLSLTRAAALLDVSPDALRKRLERLAKCRSDGMVYTPLTDGVEGRKLGRLWRVRLPGWG